MMTDRGFLHSLELMSAGVAPRTDGPAESCRHDWELVGKAGSGDGHYELYECRRCGLTKREREQEKP
jgi:hypothetical protein